MLRLTVISVIIIFISSTKSTCQITADTCNNKARIINIFLSDNSSIITKNVSIKGNKNALGIFRSKCKQFPLSEGITLSTGIISDIIGPNNRSNSGTFNHFEGDKELESISNGKTFDAVILEFDFAANTDSISFNYIFASEEYPEYVNKGLNDVFAFFISNENSKTNIAVCKQKPITVNNINSESNKEFFILNAPFKSQYEDCLSYFLQFDGLTKELKTGYRLVPYQLYHFKICIADVGDGYFDSSVFLKAHSFVSCGNKNNLKAVNIITEALKSKNFNCIKRDSTSITIVPDILFPFDSFSLPTNTFETLDHLSNLLNTFFDYDIQINGYTDNKGTDAYNKELSLKRAQSVASYLRKKGIKNERIEVFGQGKLNQFQENSYFSRKVAFKIYKK